MNLIENEKTNTSLDKPEKEVLLENVRIVKTAPSQAKIYLTSPISSNLILRVHEVGADIAIPFDVLATDAGIIHAGAVTIKPKARERTSINVHLSREIVGGLKLIASQ